MIDKDKNGYILTDGQKTIRFIRTSFDFQHPVTLDTVVSIWQEGIANKVVNEDDDQLFMFSRDERVIRANKDNYKQIVCIDTSKIVEDIEHCLELPTDKIMLSTSYEYKPALSVVRGQYFNPFPELNRLQGMIYKGDKPELCKYSNKRFGGAYGDSYILSISTKKKHVRDVITTSIPEIASEIHLRGNKYLVADIKHDGFELGKEELAFNDETVFRQKFKVKVIMR